MRFSRKGQLLYWLLVVINYCRRSATLLYRRALILLPGLTFFTCLIIPQAYALELPVSGSPTYIAINPATHQALVGYKKSNTLELLDLNTGAVSAGISLNERPSGLAIDSDSNLAVVSHKKADTVSFVDLSSGAVLGALNVGKAPRGIALDSTRRLAVVANKDDDTVSLINIDTRTVIATISVGAAPNYVTVNSVAGDGRDRKYSYGPQPHRSGH